MDRYKIWEKQGIKDLFNSEELQDAALGIAKIVSKNMIVPQTTSGLCQMIFLAILDELIFLFFFLQKQSM